jgi:hypothetical protein
VAGRLAVAAFFGGHARTHSQANTHISDLQLWAARLSIARHHFVPGPLSPWTAASSHMSLIEEAVGKIAWISKDGVHSSRPQTRSESQSQLAIPPHQAPSCCRWTVLNRRRMAGRPAGCWLLLPWSMTTLHACAVPRCMSAAHPELRRQSHAKQPFQVNFCT